MSILAMPILLALAAPAAGAEFVSKEKNFAVRFPGAHKQRALPLQENMVAMTEWVMDRNAKWFSVLAIDWAAGDPDVDAMFDAQRDDFVAGMGSLVSERFVHREGRPGREIRLKGPKEFFVMRIFFDRAARRAFEVEAGAAGSAETPEMAVFVESFRFLDSASPQTYTSVADGVSVTFPAPATTTPLPETASGTAGTVTSAHVDAIDHVLHVMRHPGIAKAEADPQRYLDYLRDGAVGAVKEGRLVSERRMEVAGRPAREFGVDVPGGQRVVTRLIVDPSSGRSYSLVIGSRPQRLERARVDAFFDSFRLLGK